MNEERRSRFFKPRSWRLARDSQSTSMSIDVDQLNENHGSGEELSSEEVSLAAEGNVQPTTIGSWNNEQLNALVPVTGPSHRTSVPIVRSDSGNEVLVDPAAPSNPISLSDVTLIEPEPLNPSDGIAGL